MGLTADDVYQAIKNLESTFPLPAPYFTVDVGTFDATSGTFVGLTTTSEFDPEPLPHGPHDHPHNPPPRFVSERRIVVTIDATWHQTITIEPAPHVKLAPVLVKFSVTGTSSPWSVAVNGVTVTGSAGQSSVEVSVWDAPVANWSISAGGHQYADVVWFQRPPAGPESAAMGAFTIPVLPVAIVYAPPVDSLHQSVASYSTAQTVGSTVDIGLTTDVSSTVPVQATGYMGLISAFAGFLKLNAAILKASGAKDESDAFTLISDQLGQVTSTQQTGITDGTDITMTLIRSTNDALKASVVGGGPGSGDVLHFYRDVRMVWAYVGGELRLCPVTYIQSFLTAAGLRNHPGTVHLSANDAKALLHLDPFTTAGQPLPTDRFQLLETWEYGFGAVISHTITTTRETKQTTTHRSFTTDTQGWEPGPLLKALGLGGSSTTTVTMTNATGDQTSTTIALEADLVSGPSDHFVVNIWYDQLFGTFAFEPLKPTATARLTGSGTAPGQPVVLRAGGRIFRTVTAADHGFRFSAPGIPSGHATLDVGGSTRAIDI
jgi:hypothetical protein